jgi:hypothetical protein
MVPAHPFQDGPIMKLFIATVAVAIAALAGEPPRFHGLIPPQR